MLPKVTGVEILREYRTSAGKCPVLMLTAKSELDDKETALDLGADDYLTKPFHTRELLARVRALLRRSHSLTQTILRAGDVELDPASCTVTKFGKELHLRPKVYSLLEFLMRHQGQVFTAEALLERVWLDDSTASVDTVRTHIKLLRRSMGPLGGEDSDQSMIRNIRNRGYMLQPQSASESLD
jgi:DNA-binding response OmpR family regulator